MGKMRVAMFVVVWLGFKISDISAVDGNPPAPPTAEDFVRCLEKKSPSSRISDAVYTAANSTFTTALKNYTRNLRYTTPKTPKPVAIVAARNASDVQAAIHCCHQVHLQMRIRSGGHDYHGLSYVSHVPFIILDTWNMRKIEIDVNNETATAQAGATVGELYYKIAEKSNALAFPAGVCPTLGLGGHIAGGGYGNLMRKYGLTIDNVIDAQVVLEDGRLLDRKAMGEEVFWAIRGGGANIGVIVSWTLKLVRVPETVTVFKVAKSVDQGATDIVLKWEQIAEKMDEDLYIRMMIDPVNSTIPGKKLSVNTTFLGMFLGDSGRLLKLMGSSFPELGLKQAELKEMKWVNSTLFWAGFPDGTRIEALLNRTSMWPPSFAKRKSDFIKKPIQKQGLETIWKAVTEEQVVSMQWNQYGGKMAKIKPTELPFPHRAGNLFLVQYVANWHDKNQTKTYLKKIRALFEAMTPYVSSNPREAFLNYRDLDIGHIDNDQSTDYEAAGVYGEKIYMGNYVRLGDIKEQVDAESFFRFEQCLPVMPPPGGK